VTCMPPMNVLYETKSPIHLWMRTLIFIGPAQSKKDFVYALLLLLQPELNVRFFNFIHISPRLLTIVFFLTLLFLSMILMR
jgi:hypothetical protein